MALGACMWGAAAAAPALDFAVPGASGLALAFAAGGIAIAILGVAEFRRAATTVDPRVPERSASLVVGGVYRYSRNPMYLGMLLVLLGWACYLGSALALAFLPVFVSYMNRFQIAPEERHMRAKFGHSYAQYTARVRRWI
jgi:protein-S-isoprenylcysteine O-methyltransferase Ste14